ncbi:unnamed protein product, partial [Nesidiocoris tenuis]
MFRQILPTESIGSHPSKISYRIHNWYCYQSGLVSREYKLPKEDRGFPNGRLISPR